MSLVGLLRAAAGERSLHGRLGLWRRRIEAATDHLVLKQVPDGTAVGQTLIWNGGVTLACNAAADPTKHSCTLSIEEISA